MILRLQKYFIFFKNQHLLHKIYDILCSTELFLHKNGVFLQKQELPTGLHSLSRFHTAKTSSHTRHISQRSLYPSLQCFHSSTSCRSIHMMISASVHNSITNKWNIEWKKYLFHFIHVFYPFYLFIKDINEFRSKKQAYNSK